MQHWGMTRYKKTNNLLALHADPELEFCVLKPCMKQMLIWRAAYVCNSENGLVFAEDSIGLDDQIYITGEREPYIVKDGFLVPVRLFNYAGSRCSALPSDEAAGQERVRPFNSSWTDARLSMADYAPRSFDDLKIAPLQALTSESIGRLARNFEVVRASNYANEWRLVA